MRYEIVRKPFMVLICMLCMIGLVACVGYNPIMYEHLSDSENYENYTATLVDIYYYNHNNDECEYNRDYTSKAFLENDVTIVVNVEEETICFEVIEANNCLLAEAGFYEGIELGETIEICASEWIYMDGYFYYIIGLSYGDVEYLNAEDGLKNMIQMMDYNRCLF